MALPASPARVLFGQIILIAVHAAIFAALGAVAWILITGDPPLVSTQQRRQLLAAGVGSLTVLGTLLVLTWKGFGWAKWVETLILFAGALLALPVLETAGARLRLLLIVLSLLALVCAALLAFIPQVEDFIRHQERTRRLLK